MPDPTIHGVLPVIQTPFLASGDIDTETLRQEIAWVLGHSADGVVTGMVSEILRMSSMEQRTLTAVVCESARTAGALAVVSCGAESTKVAVEQAAHAASVGATGVMAIPPVTTGLNDAALWDYYSAIIDEVRIPVIVQDASGYVGQRLSIDLQVGLLSKYGPDRVYFKPEAPPLGARLSALRDATNGEARIFEGSGGAALLDGFRRGIVGTMPGAEVCWAVRALWDALESGDWATAYRINGPLTGLIALQSGIDGFVAVEKHLLVRQGVFRTADVRGPRAFALDTETEEEVDRLFDQLHELVAPGQASRDLNTGARR